jgi:ATP-dependent Lon protease
MKFEHSSSKKYNLRDKTKLKKGKQAPPSDSDEEDSLYETCSEDSDSSYQPRSRSHRKKRIESDDEDDDDDDDDEDDEDDDDDDDEKEKGYSRKDFRNLLADRFPSKYINKKIEKEENLEKEKTNKTNRREQNTKKEKVIKKEKKDKKSNKKSKSPKRNNSRNYQSEEDDDDEDYDDEEDDEDDKKNKYNIIFTIGERNSYSDEYYDDEEEFTEDEDDEEEEEPNSEDDEKIFMKEYFEKEESDKEEEKHKKSKEKSKKLEKEKSKKSEKSSKKSEKEKKSKKSKHQESEEDDDSEQTRSIKKPEKDEDIENEYLELLDLKKHLKERLVKKPKSKILLNAMDECKETIKDLIYDARHKNTKEYYKLINKDKKRTNEVDYFKKKMSNKEQLKVMKDLKEINDHIYIEKPYRLALLESKMPSKFKAIALQKLNVLRSMEPGDPEYYKIKNWVDTFMKIPFCQYKHLSITMNDGLEVCHNFMSDSKKILDDCVFGLNDAKLQIMQMVGQWVANPSAMGTAIAIHGPPGTGKTSIVKEGISKILGRDFAFIALGGAGDSSFLEGHSYTYEGSSWGKIVQILIESKSMNPVIYFDELDKVSDTARGQEIIGVLTHLTDTSQNSEFHDKYFSEVDFDLSKCLFIFSYNDESKVNPILKDRMYRIQTKGYDTKEKMVIAKNYILSKIREQVNFREEDIIIPDDTLQYIITNQAFTKGEEGVRNLKRCLEIIYTKLNLFRLMKPEENFFSKDMNIKVEFPFTVTRQHADLLIKSDITQNQSLLAMYV